MAVAGAAAMGVAAFLLHHLNDDELEVIARALAVPLEPHVLVALASTCRGLRVPTAAVVAELVVDTVLVLMVVAAVLVRLSMDQ